MEMDAVNEVSQFPRENIKTSFLDIFSKLTLDKEKLRVKGGVALIKHLARNSLGGKDLKYALTRLIRGLGASNNEIKRRYFSVLVALLSCTPEISTQKVFEIIEKELSLSASNSKSENADAAFGQVLTCGALIRARTVGEKKELVETILSAGKKRSYLYLAALTFILELCNGVEEDEFKKLVWPMVKPEFPEDHTMDSLYLLLSLKRKYPCFNKLEGIVCEESLLSLATVLTNIPGVSWANHPVYEVVAEELVKTGLAVPFLSKVDLTAFNYNRFLVTTKILCGVIACLNEGTALPDLLLENYMAQISRYLKTCQHKDDALQVSLCELFDVIGKAQLDTETQITVLKHFLFHPMVSVMDKTARSLIAGLNEDGVKALAELCRDVMHDGARTNHNKVYAAKLLAKLLGHPQSHKELPWKIEQLKFLMEMALLKNHVSAELSGLLRGTFFQALDLKLPRLEDLRAVLSELVHHLEAFLQAPDDFRRPLNPMALETWQKTMALIHKLEKKNKIKHVTLVFLVLFLHMSLQLFNEVKLANDSLGELVLCYEKIKQSGGEVVVLWIEVIIDLFLSLLSHNSHLLRSLIRSVFPHLCKYVNATALHQILFVLDPMKEDNPLSPDTENEEDLEEDESDAGESSSEFDEDEENETVNNKLRMALQAALNTRSDKSEESLDLDEMSDVEGKRLDEALAVAFKQFKPNLGRNTKKKRKDKEVLTHFRIRVLDLLDVYISSGPAMFLCLEAIPPLLRLLEFSVRDPLQDPLVHKVRSILQKLCSTKKFRLVEDVNETNLCALLKDLVGKNASGVDDAVSECCVFIVRCALHLVQETSSGELPIEEINEILLGVLQSTNQSALSLLLIKKTLQSTWPGNMALVVRLMGLAFSDETRMFKRVRFLELLRVFYSNHRALLKNAEIFARDLKECERKFVENTVTELTSICVAGVAKQAYMRSLFAVLSEIKRNSKGDAPWWAELAECLQKCGSGLAVSQEAKCTFRALCKSLGVKEVVKAEKRKLVEDGVDESASEKRPRSKAKSPKGKKDKKEKRLLRMSAMSEGLAGFNFSNAIISSEGNDSEWKTIVTQGKK